MGMYVYKMFGKGLKCRGYQFHVGLNECDHATCAREGFHAAYNPLDCLSYYHDFEGSECWLCYADGEVHEDGSDSKISCTRLEILKRLSLAEFIYEAVRYIIEHPKRPLHYQVKKDKGSTSSNHFAIVVGEKPEAKALCDGDVIALLIPAKSGDGYEKLVFLHGGEVKKNVTYTTERDEYDDR